MVEGDLVDLTLPTLLHALSREGSTAMLRLQHGTEQGALYFCEGALVHAAHGDIVGDEAVLELLAWSDGRFRIVRDADKQPRTITSKLIQLLSSDDGAHGRVLTAPGSSGGGISDEDEQLLTTLLTLLTRLEQDRVRLEGQVEAGAVAALLVLTTIVNSLVAFVTTKCSDPAVLPSRVLPRLAETLPYTQLLGEENERISIATAAGVLKAWKTDSTDRQQLFEDLCRALLDVLTVYCNTVNTFFHSSREREEWRATFDVFVDGLWEAVRQVKA